MTPIESSSIPAGHPAPVAIDHGPLDAQLGGGLRRGEVTVVACAGSMRASDWCHDDARRLHECPGTPRVLYVTPAGPTLEGLQAALGVVAVDRSMLLRAADVIALLRAEVARLTTTAGLAPVVVIDGLQALSTMLDVDLDVAVDALRSLAPAAVLATLSYVDESIEDHADTMITLTADDVPGRRVPDVTAARIGVGRAAHGQPGILAAEYDARGRWNWAAS